jgi:hypothetical protein
MSRLMKKERKETKAVVGFGGYSYAPIPKPRGQRLEPRLGPARQDASHAAAAVLSVGRVLQ